MDKGKLVASSLAEFIIALTLIALVIAISMRLFAQLMKSTSSTDEVFKQTQFYFNLQNSYRNDSIQENTFHSIPGNYVKTNSDNRGVKILRFDLNTNNNFSEVYEFIQP